VRRISSQHGVDWVEIVATPAPRTQVFASSALQFSRKFAVNCNFPQWPAWDHTGLLINTHVSDVNVVQFSSSFQHEPLCLVLNDATVLFLVLLLEPSFRRLHGSRLGIGKQNAYDQAPEWRVDYRWLASWMSEIDLIVWMKENQLDAPVVYILL
jgi:hypothetical protein